jgi:glycosyltransferase involved in cell wall biosynthesis
MRHFHGGAARVFAVTRTLASELEARGIGPVHHWPLGVDLKQFSPHAVPLSELASVARPIILSVGRVAVEKNLDAFLSLDLPGSKAVVGDGPALEELRRRYPDAHFLGALHGAQLASAYGAADVFVFPRRTDTFGLVNIEALASGLPVAAYPVPGPIDIVGRRGVGHYGGELPIGALDEDLASAIRRALKADRQACVVEAANYEWDRCTDEFLAGLALRRVETACWAPLGEPAWLGLAVPQP